MSLVCYGADHDDALIMTYDSFRGSFIDEFYAIINQRNDFNRILFTRSEDIRKHASAWIYEKNENYNFEEIIETKYKRDLKREITYPIYILKNKIWFQWSPNPGIMVPCQGRYADLTGIVL